MKILFINAASVDGGEMETQTHGEEEERRRDREQGEDEEHPERSSQSTIHTVPELLMDLDQVLSDGHGWMWNR